MTHDPVALGTRIALAPVPCVGPAAGFFASKSVGKAIPSYEKGINWIGNTKVVKTIESPLHKTVDNLFRTGSKRK